MENNKKTSAQRAQDKFKRVGTKLNEQELGKFNEILEREGVNQSQYIKGLIMGNMTYYEDLIELQRKKDILLLKQKDKIEKLENDILILRQQEKIEKLENQGRWEKLKNLFK